MTSPFTKHLPYIIIYLVLDAAMLCIATLLTLRFFRIVRSRPEKIIKGIIFPAFLQFISFILLLISGSIHHILWALESPHAVAYSLYAVFYALCYYWKWCYLFFRLHLVFGDSAMKLSRFTIVVYKVILICSPILIIILLLSSKLLLNDGLRGGIQGAVVVYALLVSASIVITFITKLAKITAESAAGGTDGNQVQTVKLQSVITRNVLLSLTALLFTVIVIIAMFAAATMRNRDAVWWIVGYVILIDGFSNFMTIILSFSFFDGIYGKLCGRIDRNHVAHTQLLKLASLRSNTANISISTVPKDKCGICTPPVSPFTPVTDGNTTGTTSSSPGPQVTPITPETTQ